MLTFEAWLGQWLIDADRTLTGKEIDGMRDAWNGALETIADSAKDFQSKTESKADWSERQPS